MGSDTHLVHKEILFFMVFTNLIIGISYTSLPRAQFLSWRNLVKVKKGSFSGSRLTLSCPTLYQEAPIASLLVEKNKDIKAPARQLFHQG